MTSLGIEGKDYKKKEYKSALKDIPDAGFIEYTFSPTFTYMGINQNNYIRFLTPYKSDIINTLIYGGEYDKPTVIKHVDAFLTQYKYICQQYGQPEYSDYTSLIKENNPGSSTQEFNQSCVDLINNKQGMYSTKWNTDDGNIFLNITNYDNADVIEAEVSFYKAN
ncbi:MAG: hypothetical protein WCJ92_07490 [Alphaproteobacteria bacterium]